MGNRTPDLEESLLSGCFLLLAFILVLLDPEAVGGFGRLPELVIGLSWKKDFQIVENFFGINQREILKSLQRLGGWFANMTKWVQYVIVTLKQEDPEHVKDKTETF